MCGIVAIWSPDAGLAPADLGPIEVLRHRGPDSVARWVSATGEVGLAQSRLAVVGIANGDQPVRNTDGSVRAVVNGEFYGYRQVRRDLARRGHHLATESDSEIAAHLYEEDPDRFVTALRGEFALVLWDEIRQRLTAVRDRFGVKPLFYTWIDGRLVLASEVKALFAAGAVRRWDEESFHDYLHACFGPDRSLFAGIHQLPPGAMLRVERGSLRVSQYWEPNFPEWSTGHATEDAHEAVRDAVEEAVRLRLVADVPVGAHLSGGLDSSSVVGVAAAQIPLRTFTIRFPLDPRDEGATAARTAAALGTHHHEIAVPDKVFTAATVAAVTAGEMLQENGHGTARLAQSTAIHEAGLRVALSGEGGDELFAGYDHLRADLRLSASPEALVRARRAYRSLAAGPVSATLTGTLSRLGFVPGWLINRAMHTALPVAALLRPDFAARFAGRDSLGALIDGAHGQLDGRSPAHQSLYLFLRTWFCNYILAAERLDMARAVEVRLPLLDHHLFEVARALPPAELLRGDTKRVLREAMRGYLTDEVFRAPKRPFYAPPGAGATRLAAVLRQRVDDGALADNPFFDLRAVRAFLARIESGTTAPTEVEDRMLHLLSSVTILQSAYALR
ncbi:asparagine synthase (glutamine-hydrolyzing) [Micromonospora lutea]|uniref:asparagine synthase (glutamine-hydrolyzing) n=1 Tax=Micromonospora lutea TaxID=419825 RepID=A0ABQ4IT00_9ACTN|nr:asparagine synthase (glutamine-hydrolyzing) [Micromonospora lutea]GIJ21049.1 asparagine synthase (glutamine-hydrolyzing) [Micromonospora lutea]